MLLYPLGDNMVEKVYDDISTQLSVYYTQFLFLLYKREKSYNKIQNLIPILNFIYNNYQKFNKEELIDVRNICLISEEIINKIEDLKTIKIDNIGYCKTLLYSIKYKIKGSN